ncbi:protein TPX2 [Quillaja saponaria]|uniref:Protein TPX2 n=1 Tax=Quillaja saponaria TaxID=32244 RepID=A0AAD7PXL9_QUISA|nr:protein TPX2 [Quillaja saponaria]
MEAISKTPLKDPHGSRSKNQESSKFSSKLPENLDPNLSRSSPNLKHSNSPFIKSEKAQKSVGKNPKPVVYSPQKKIRQRKFIVAKKNLKKEDPGSRVICKCGGNTKKCLCVAYENLRASQEEFFKNRGCNEENGESDQSNARDRAEIELEEEMERKLMIQDLQIADGHKRKEEEGDGTMINESENGDPGETPSSNEIGSSTIKRRRDKLLEEARTSVPEPGSGRVLHLVKAFEKILSIPSSNNSDEKEEEEEKQPEKNKNIMKWALPGLQTINAPETQVSSSSFCPSGMFLTSENLGLNSRISVSSSWDSSQGSISSRTSNGGRRSRRNSSESSDTFGGKRWKKKQQQKATSQKPFKLRTEQRGILKEEEFMKKMQEMMIEEERQRIPIAQGLPWTTDEPECLMKPPVKENTRPVDLKLHSDIRATDRAEFDHQVAEKISMIEQYKMERERQRKLAEEEEVRRLRKELVPKAQPMPYFDRPFIPRRSMKNPTMPKEPRFHIPDHKKIKCCLSWNDLTSYTFEQ